MRILDSDINPPRRRREACLYLAWVMASVRVGEWSASTELSRMEKKSSSSSGDDGEVFCFS